MSTVLAKLPYSDHVFKVAPGPTPLSIRIWPTSISSNKPAPFFFWSHGGAWIAGSHRLPRPWAPEAFVKAGYHFVSCEYRLMPQVELKEIVQDLLDGIQWCKKELPGLLGGDKVDITRYAVGGESAGGTTATMLGHLASPPPLAVLNVYGMVDFVIKRLPVTSDATTPFSPASGLFTEAQVASELANRDLSNTLGEVLDDWVNNDPADLRHARYGDHPKPAYGERQKLRRDAHDYMIARGMLWQTLFHVDDPEKQAKLFERKQREMSALLLLDDVRTYPPTYVYHGTADVLVHVSQSDRFVAKLKQKGVPVEYAKIEGGPHVCDQYEDENSDEWKQNVLPIVAFMNKYVKAL